MTTTSEHTAALCVVVIVACSGVLVNLVILLTLHRRKITSPSNLLLLQLSASNLLLSAALGSLLFVDIEEVLPLWRLTSTVLFGFGSVSINTRTAIAIERSLLYLLLWCNSNVYIVLQSPEHRAAIERNAAQEEDGADSGRHLGIGRRVGVLALG
jgi:zinc transporter ZupT